MAWRAHNKLLSIFVVFFLIAVSIFGWNIYKFEYSPLIFATNTEQIVTVEPNSSAAQFTQQLKNKQLIQAPNFFLALIRYKGLSQQLKAGVYQIKPGESAMNFLHRVVAGDVLVKHLTIVEGTTAQKIAQDLATASYLEYHPQDWQLIKDNHPNAEGLLLADTYQYRGGSKSLALLQQAHKNLTHYLDTAWASRAADLPYKNAYELLIAASIIERETAIAQEKKIISGIVINRLKKNMPLQMDPTVIYGLGNQLKGKLTHNDLLIDSPYNTYRNRGLPPTPIAMVGKEAIDAAAHPQLSNYLYYVAKGDGSHQFSENYEQQKQAIERFRHKDF